MASRPVKIYSNADVDKIIGFIPRGHMHMRLIIELSDQTIILHEATVAAIVRAYVNIVAHPEKKAIELSRVCRERQGWKLGYATCQLVETGAREDEVIKYAESLLESTS